MRLTTLPTERGDIQVATVLPTGTVRGIVQVNHGLAEHSRCYARLTRDLTRAGQAVVLHDHRGHGTAPYASARRFGPGGWDRVVEDARMVQVWASDRWNGVPLIVLGFSMGSVVALEAAARGSEGLSGLVLAGAPVQRDPFRAVSRALLAVEGLVLGEGAASVLFERLGFARYNAPFAPTRTPFDWLSEEREVVDRYVADPDCGWPVRNGMAQDVLEGIDGALRRAERGALRSSLPILLLSGEHDPVSGGKRAVLRFADVLRRAGSSSIETAIVAGGRHNILHGTDDHGREAVLRWARNIAGAAEPLAA